MNPGSGQARRLLWGMASGALLAVAAYAAMAWWAGRGAYLSALSAIPAEALLAGLALSSVNFLLRFVRWHFFLRAAQAPLPAGWSLWIFISGLAFTITPGKAGEAVKTVFCNRFGVPHRTTLAAVWLERLFDLLAVALLFSMGLFLLGASWAKLAILVWGGIAALAWMAHAPSGRRFILRLLARWQAPLEGWFAEMDRMATRRRLVPVLLLSAAGWLCEGIAFWWILRNLSVPAGLAFSQSAYFAATLAGVFFPGGLGGTEGALAWALSARAGAAVTGAAVTAIRAVTLGWATAVGLVAAVFLLLRLRKDSE